MQETRAITVQLVETTRFILGVLLLILVLGIWAWLWVPPLPTL